MLVANMNEFLSPLSSSTTKGTTKTLPQAQHELIRIVFVIDNKGNDKDAAAGTTMIESYRLRRHRQQSERQGRRRGHIGGRRWRPLYWTALLIEYAVCHVSGGND